MATASSSGSRAKSSRRRYLTERQKAILEFIADYQARNGISPTHREIREEFGYSSFGTVYKHLKLLQEKGYLRRDWNQKRGLELLRAVPGVATPTQEVPFMGQIAAGQPIEALPGEEKLAVPEHLFEGQAPDHYVLRVTGESMIEEGIYDGDLVVVLRREMARTGEMVVALIEGDATLKRFYPEGETIRLQPANPLMDAIRVPANSVKVQGVVVGLMRKF
ncbi:MAG: transcriptional repressor LexA [Thermoanaerobaculia bacterium]|nr:transcriptional repressor LexA [Thermoanaerobaculia bacterium]